MSQDSDVRVDYTQLSNIWNCPVVATAISRENRKPMLEGNGCLTDQA
jgi:hypothetical protein